MFNTSLHVSILTIAKSYFYEKKFTNWITVLVFSSFLFLALQYMDKI